MPNPPIDLPQGSAPYLEALYHQFLNDPKQTALFNEIDQFLSDLEKSARKVGYLSLIEYKNQLELATRLELVRMTVTFDTQQAQAIKKFFSACCQHLHFMLENLQNQRIPEFNPDKKRVVIIDPSETSRSLLVQVIQMHPNLAVVGVANSIIEGRKLIENLHPDVIALELFMPETDGFTFLDEIMNQHPIPVVVISEIDQKAVDQSKGKKLFDALYRGAIDFIPRSSISSQDIVAKKIGDRLLAAAQCELQSLRRFYRLTHTHKSNTNLDLDKLVAIGASLGAMRTLIDFLSSLPKEIPPIILVQNTIPEFPAVLIQELHEICPFIVKEASDGDFLMPNQILIAPSGAQLMVDGQDSLFKVHIAQGNPINEHLPSIDVLFDSVAICAGDRAVGILLSGADADGAESLAEIRKSGGYTIAQAEGDCPFPTAVREAIRHESVMTVSWGESLSETLCELLAKKGVNSDDAATAFRFGVPGPKVLVVDDSPTIRAIICYHLKEIGILRFEEAKDGVTAWNMLTQALKTEEPYNLVISDQVMPGMEGQTLLKKIRTHAKLKDLPFILSTSNTDKASVLGAIEGGVTGYITKPISFTSLTKRLSAIFL